MNWRLLLAGQQARLEQLGKELGLADPPRPITLPGDQDQVVSLPVERPGLRVEVCLRQRGKQEVLCVLVPVPGLPRLEIRREDFFDRIGKRWSLNREFQTGDREFDEAVYLESNERDRILARVLGAAEVRQQLLELFRGNPLRVVLGPSGIIVELVAYTLKGFDRGAQRVARALEALPALVAALPKSEPGEAPAPLRQQGDGLVLATFVAFAAGSVTSAFGPWGTADFGSPVDRALLSRLTAWSFAGWLATIPLVWAYVRGHSHSLRSLVAYLLLSPFLAAFPIPLAPYMANRLLDDGPARHAVVVVQGKRLEGSKQNQTVLWLGDWRTGTRHPVALKVDRVTFQRFAEGESAALTLRSGAFGWEWIERMEKAAAAEAAKEPAP